MKIVQIMPYFGLGGAEIMCENLIYELIKLGHDVTVISLFNSHTPITDRLEAAGTKVIYLDKKLGFDFSVIKKIREICKIEKPDAIHTHLYALKYAVLATMFLNNIRIIHTIHSVAEKEAGNLSRKINRIFYKLLGVIPVALSELIRESVMKEYNLPRNRVSVIFNGIDLSKCMPKTDYSIGEKIKILHIGRFSEEKNHIGLLEAFELFNLKYPNSVLQLIGDGEKRSEIENFIKEKNLVNCVEILGLQDNVYNYLHSADIFALPSLYEGIPITIIEAMGTGLPIVATNVGGIPDMLKDSKSALLVNIDSEEISVAFEKLTNDNDLRERLGKSALNESGRFSSLEMARKYYDLYKNGVIINE